jgi:hypothetical protein
VSNATTQGTHDTVDAHGCTCKAGQAHKPVLASCGPPAALQGGRARPAVARYLPYVWRADRWQAVLRRRPRLCSLRVCGGDGSHYGKPRPSRQTARSPSTLQRTDGPRAEKKSCLMPAESMPRIATLHIVITSPDCASFRLVAEGRIIWRNRVLNRPVGHAGARHGSHSLGSAAWGTGRGREGGAQAGVGPVLPPPAFTPPTPVSFYEAVASLW